MLLEERSAKRRWESWMRIMERRRSGSKKPLTRCGRMQGRLLQQTALEVVELYPYIEYMKYLLPGSITLAMFVSVMIGGGMLYIDDKARGVHEGYLVTPITKTEMVFGLNLAGAIKAVLTGVVITVIGALLAGVSTIFNPATVLGLFIMIGLTSVAFNTMMFLLIV